MVINQPDDVWDGAAIRLRPLQQEDFEAMQASLEDPGGGEKTMEGQRRSPASPRHEQARLWKRLPNATHPDEATWAIETVQGQLVGAIGIAGCHRKRGNFTFALALMRPFRRQGYGREAVRLVLGTYFRRGYHKATVAVPEYNQPATRFFDALGFTREGRLRNLLVLDGQHYDKLYYGLTAEEFALFELGEATFITQGAGGQS